MSEPKQPGNEARAAEAENRRPKAVRDEPALPRTMTGYESTGEPVWRSRK